MIPPTRRRPAPSLATYALPAAALIVLGGGGLLWLAGAFRPKQEGPRPLVQPPGTVAVPMAARPIKAYTKMTRDDLWDAKNGRFAVVFLPPDQVTPAMMTTIADITGRVLGRDKTPGYVFTEDDFLPKGTRPGVVAGIPAGKRALRLEAEKVLGLIGLRAGDRFDLVATVPIDPSKQSGRNAVPNVGGAYGALLAQQLAQASGANGQKQANVRVVVQGGVVVTPVETRAVPTSTMSLTQGARTQTRPVQEMVIAIDPTEVAPLTEAMAIGAVLTCLPRSGRPDDPADSTTPGLTADLSRVPGLSTKAPQLTLVDHIQGECRALIAVPEGELAGE
ncbi:MAG: hypothetical protein KIT58_06465 [Planctomycetota bacterium]|nr:hypothetical protein [Planctomycetota bacterium]